MPRVLLFRSELLPLSETFIVGQAGALARYEPWFAGLKRISEGIPLDESRVIVAAKSNSLRDKIARKVYLRTGIVPQFMRKIEAVEPHLIHAHFATDGCAALAIKERLGIPLIVTLHGYDVTSKDAGLRKLGVGRAYLRRRETLWERADLFVCISDFIRQKALERGFPSEKLWVHSTGIDLKTFQPGDGPMTEPLILFVGRLVEVKGCARLLRAMRSVEVWIPHAKLVVIGDGPLRMELEAQARSALTQCEFLGAQNTGAVRDWMRRAAVVAVPSEDREGLSMVALEAQAMRVPVVGFAGSGVAEAVEDSETGLLVAQDDEAALADAIVTLLKDQDLATQMGVRGRMRVANHFDLHRQTARLEDKYDEVLGRR